MELYTGDSDIRELCDDPDLMRRRYGTATAKRPQKRIMELLACETLADMKLHRGARLHLLHPHEDGCFAVNIDGAYRLLLRPARDPVPLLADGGIDLSQITGVTLLEVVDYHDG